MDLIPGVVLFTGVIATLVILGLDTSKNRRPITNAEILQSRKANHSNQQKQKRGFFNRG